MPQKKFTLEQGLVITIYKRKGNRNLRLSLDASGKVRVSIPAWAPYSAGLTFAKSRQAWISDQRQTPDLLIEGQPIGKAHRIHFAASPTAQKSTSRIKGNQIVITYPQTLDMAGEPVQQIARLAGLRALRLQAQQLLPQRLAALAGVYGFTYRGVIIKQLKGRWGSCDQQKNIVLNLFLMQLPWDCIDYVLLHELTHTRVLKHGPDFWQAMEQVQPDAKKLRKRLHSYRPVLVGSPVA